MKKDKSIHINLQLLGNQPDAPICPKCGSKFGGDVGGFASDNGCIVCSNCNPKEYKRFMKDIENGLKKMPKEDMNEFKEYVEELRRVGRDKQKEIKKLNYFG